MLDVLDEQEDAVETLLPIPEAATCGECGTFARGWMGRHWKCRRGDRHVNADSEPCQRWRPREPDVEPDFEAMREAADAIGRMLGELPPMLTTPTPRPRPPGLRGHTGGVVYFIDCGAMTKIGHTGGWIEDRMKGIATDNPFDLKLWGLVKGSQRFEREWHAAMAHFRYRNEWFTLSHMARESIKDWLAANGGEIYE